MTKKKLNWKIVIYSIIALGFIYLTFTIVMMYLNQRELMKK